MTNSPHIGMKTSSAPAIDAGQRQRQGHAPERAARPAAEIGRGLEQRRIELLQRGVERQHHERQIGIDEPDLTEKSVVEERQRLVDEADIHQQRC